MRNRPSLLACLFLLLVVDGEIAKKGAPTGVMKGTTAIAAAPSRRGGCSASVPTPNGPTTLHDMVYRALLWVTRR